MSTVLDQPAHVPAPLLSDPSLFAVRPCCLNIPALFPGSGIREDQPQLPEVRPGDLVEWKHMPNEKGWWPMHVIKTAVSRDNASGYFVLMIEGNLLSPVYNPRQTLKSGVRHESDKKFFSRPFVEAMAADEDKDGGMFRVHPTQQAVVDALHSMQNRLTVLERAVPPSEPRGRTRQAQE